MSVLTLPEMIKDPIGSYPYFPTRQQLYIWRNWEMVPVERLAAVLKTDAATVNSLAADMGLRVPAKFNAEYPKRGFVTIIRNNWHVIPYQQLLETLDWTYDQLAYTLKEDDFLSVKLLEKPDVEPIVYTPLTPTEKEDTKKLKQWNELHFSELRDKITAEDFSFIKSFGKPVRKKTGANPKSVVVDSAWGIKDTINSYNTKAFIRDFNADTEREWGFSFTGNKKFITLVIEPDESKKAESHRVKITKDGITVTSVDEAGLLKGLNYLSFIADKNDSFSFDEAEIVRDTRFDIRYIYSYCALYGDALIEGGVSSYPNELLKEYSRIGINGIWIHTVLYKLVEFPWAPELSVDWQKRLDGLASFVKRAGEYGIKVYLYLNEPRAMPMKFFDEHPELLGYSNGAEGSLCTSTPEVQKYLTDGVTTICKAAPDVGGFFTITASENFTNCYSHRGDTPCPRCSKRKALEVIAEVNLLIARAARKINKNINVIAWNWGWGHIEDLNEMAELIGDEGVRVMCTSEEGVTKTIGGIQTSVIDYSISLVGPGDKAKSFWNVCKSHGVKTMAKVQFNNTWEGSTVPYLPVFDLVRQHMQGLVESKVDGLMIGWTLGGYPSINLEILSQYYWTNEEPHASLVSIFGNESSLIAEATATFSKAFQEFPFHIGTLYKGPQHMGPSNPLFEHQTKLYATMTGFPYDNMEQWRSIYPLDIFEKQLKLLTDIWKNGLDKLNSELTPEKLDQNKRLAEFVDIATATYCLYRSSYQQVVYNRARNAYDEETDASKKAELKKTILEFLDKEIDIAMTMYKIMLHNSTIGYEAANHYFFNKYSMIEKVVDCEYLKERFNNK